jgi:uncharacterized membrane protein YoaK (UPF0700 family)
MRLSGLIEWPGYFRLRMTLTAFVVAVIYQEPDVLGLILWVIAALVVVNLLVWLFGPRALRA